MHWVNYIVLPKFQGNDFFYLHSFFYKNKVYKNVEPQICPKLKNILDAEIVIILQLFLSPHMEAQNTFFARKSCLFWHVLGKYQVKNSKICENFANFSKN